jgi:hypothetical protein
MSSSAWFASKRDSCWRLMENSIERRMQYDCRMMVTIPVSGSAGDKSIWIPRGGVNVNPFLRGDPGKHLNLREQMVVAETGIG